MKPSAIFRNRNGQLVNTSLLLGKGGEGSVYEIAGSPAYVAKVYHKPISDEKAAKLNAMADMKTDQLLALTAWPVEVLSNNRDGKVCGFIMPNVTGHKDIHTLYTPKSRKDNFPQADWRFLVHTAANVARAFTLIHEHGCVVGDVNHGSVLVSSKATVRLIDCDSFQVTAQNKRYLCDVGVPTYTAPELQGKSFRGVVRSANHDNFGLAVMIFHLLFMGRHPFAGRYLGSTEMPIERAITEFRFAFGSNRKLAQMEPPPNTLLLQAASTPVANLLERAFSREGIYENRRPAAREWVSALDALEQQLKKCSSNASHYYFAHHSSCPWCKIEAATGVVLFSLYIQHGGQTIGFNMALIWQKIIDVQPPPPPNELAAKTTYNILPSKEAVDIGFKQKIRKIVAYGLIGGAGATLLSGVLPGFLGLLLVIIAISSRTAIIEGGEGASKFIIAYKNAEALWNTIHDRWQREAGNKQFHEKLDQLRRIKAEWEGLPALRQRRYQQLEADREKNQRERFLESHLIQNAKIPKVGPSRKAMLESYNIETAADVTQWDVQRVPSFGKTYTKILLDWRRSVEQRFVFNRSKGVDPKDIAALDREIADTKRKNEALLMGGAAGLLQIRGQIMTARHIIYQDLEAAYKKLLQAEADKKAAGS